MSKHTPGPWRAFPASRQGCVAYVFGMVGRERPEMDCGCMRGHTRTPRADACARRRARALNYAIAKATGSAS